MDLMIIIPNSIFMCFHGSHLLNKSYPSETLFTKSIVFSLLGHGVIFIFVLIFTLKRILFLNDGVTEVQIVFITYLITCVELIIICILFTKGEPFRKKWFKNKYLFGNLFFNSFLICYFLYSEFVPFLLEFNNFIASILESAPLGWVSVKVIHLCFFVQITSHVLFELVLRKLYKIKKE